ncbi:hypothetical protein ACOMHN_041253 [Nucella lapillus]
MKDTAVQETIGVVKDEKGSANESQKEAAVQESIDSPGLMTSTHSYNADSAGTSQKERVTCDLPSTPSDSQIKEATQTSLKQAKEASSVSEKKLKKKKRSRQSNAHKATTAPKVLSSHKNLRGGVHRSETKSDSSKRRQTSACTHIPKGLPSPATCSPSPSPPQKRHTSLPRYITSPTEDTMIIDLTADDGQGSPVSEQAMDRDLQSVGRRWTGISSQGTGDGQGSPISEQTMDRDLQSVNRRWTGISSQGTGDGQGSPIKEQTINRDLQSGYRRWTGISSQGTDDGQGSPVREQAIDRDLQSGNRRWTGISSQGTGD